MKRTPSLAIAAAVAFCSLISLMPMPASAGQPDYRTSLVRWRGSEGAFSTWTLDGTGLDPAGRLRLDEATAVPGTDPYPAGGYLGGNYYNGGSFVVGEATSPVTMSTHGFAEAITSWNADTPPGTWIEVQLRARVDGRFTKFYNLGIWAEDSSTVQRHSVRAQGDADGFVAVDTVVLDKKLTGDAFQIKIRLFSAVSGSVPTVANSFVALSSTLGKIRSTPAGDPALWDGCCPCPSAPRGLPRRRRRVVQPDVHVDGRGLLGQGHRALRAQGAGRRRRRLRLGLRRATATGRSTPPTPPPPASRPTSPGSPAWPTPSRGSPPACPS